MFFLLFLVFLFFVAGRCFGPWGWRRYHAYDDHRYGYGPQHDPRQMRGPWSYGPPPTRPSHVEPLSQPPVV